MAIFKCKMCGGTLEIDNNQTTVTCEYCGTQQTLPKLDDDRKANLYDRANHFRRNNEFDKAMGIYEQILNEDKMDAEAYWSLVLCRYGIEYVEDPSSRRRVPTINRVQFTSILADEDYKSALQYADISQRSIYELEAKAIDKIQKEILAISNKEDPFDVFICYKESDNTGKRTPDSVLAQDLYYGLKNEGFKVFFSRITLEDKLGSAYEPYIFAALNSAKVMVVLGTKPEYFNAVWVKNEWSRYLSLIKQGQKKMLIPAYKDMDPYDLPEEFSHLQAQDMSKLGFMQDLIRGIKKIVRADQPKVTVVKETVVKSESANTDNLLKRALLFIEDKDYDSANEYAEKVLDINPECSDAYIVKLLIDLRLTTPSQISSCKSPIDKNPNYIKALRFAQGDDRAKIENYNKAILEHLELERKLGIYNQGCNLMKSGKYDNAISYFSQVKDFKDSSENIQKCKELIETARKETIYSRAISAAASSYADDKTIKNSIASLKTIPGYKDADAQVDKLQVRLEKWYEDKKIADEKARVKAEQARIKAEQEKMEKARQEELRKLKAAENRKRAIKMVKIGAIIAVVISLLTILMTNVGIPLIRLVQADALFEQGKYDEADQIYNELVGFGNSRQRSQTVRAVNYLNSKKYGDAVRTLLSAGVPVEIEYNFNGATSHSSADSVVVFNTSSDFKSLITPEKNGQAFSHWNMDGFVYDLSAKDGKFTIKLSAVWGDVEYDIVYNLGGGNVEGNNPTNYNFNTNAFTLINPTREGYTFVGWVGTDITEPTKDVTVEKGSYGNREYTAVWESNGIKITFNANGGTCEESQIVVNYDEMFSLPIPTRKGYSFLGWVNGAQRVNDGLCKFTSDVTLTAQWDITEYVITYDLKGGTVNGKNTVNYNINTGSFTLINPTRVGYTFAGWIGTDITEPTKNVTVAKGSYGDREYTAVWESNSIVITFDPNGGTCGESQIVANYDENLVLPTPTWVGHTFSGWFNGNQRVSNGICKYTENMNLVARWDAIEYTIEYELNGGINSMLNPSYYTNVEEVIFAEPTREGYTFLGWTYSGQSTPVKNLTIPVGTTGSKKYTANWKANSYTINFDADGGSVSSNSITVTYDEAYTLPTPTKTGYTFKGWSSGSKTYVNGVWTETEDVSLTAKWQANKYTVSYDANGGKVSTSSESVTYDSSYALATPSRTGYEFLGWYNGNTLIDQNGNWNIAKNVTLVAKWKAKTYKVTYDAGEGTSSVTSATATYDASFTLATASRTGYTFVGWYYNGVEYTDGVWKTDKDITLTAKWSANTGTKYTVNHYQQNIYDDGYTLFDSEELRGTSNSSVMPQVYYYEGFTSPSSTTATINPDGSLVVDYYYTRNEYSITLVTNGGTTAQKVRTFKYQEEIDVDDCPTRAGYTFGGWFTDVDLIQEFATTEMPTRNIIIYAYWSEEDKPYRFVYDEKENEITITRGNSESEAVVIPAFINDKPVTSIYHEAFKNYTSLTSVVIPDSVTSIGLYAFSNCTSLTSVNIPEGVTSIADYTFSHCTSLKSITLPDSVTIIEAYAFNTCTSLAEITIPKNVVRVEHYAFKGCSSLASITFKNPEGWWYAEYHNSKSGFSIGLSNPEKAAYYLTDYFDYAYFNRDE